MIAGPLVPWGPLETADFIVPEDDGGLARRTMPHRLQAPPPRTAALPAAVDRHRVRVVTQLCRDRILLFKARVHEGGVC